MTVLVDKLEKELARNCRLNNWDLGFQAAIDIVKQHSDWQNLSSDTQLQDGQTDAVIERPQTLVEKLEQERGYYLQEYQSCLDSHDVVNAIDSCIDIVKQHSQDFALVT